MGTNEKLASTIRAYGSSCIGCQKYDREIMVTVTEENIGGFLDIFLTKPQAENLLHELAERLAEK